MTTAFAVEPTFLYPTSRQFPFDEVCERIVRALEERNWDVPGIAVEFDVYGTGTEKYRIVRDIRGEDFRLHFNRVQGCSGRWNDVAAVTDIIIPRKEISVYSDESGPVYTVYAGEDWDTDKEQFLGNLYKLNDEPYKQLTYKGACDCRGMAGASFAAVDFLTATLSNDFDRLIALTHTHSNRRPPLLVIYNHNLGEQDAPAVYRTHEVFEEFALWLERNLLVRILAQPVSEAKTNTFKAEEAIPFPDGIGPLFCFAERKDAYRIRRGQTDIEKLEPSDRYGMLGNGYRLLSLTVSNDGTIPQVAYDGFLWCGTGEVTSERVIDSLDIPGHHRWQDREQYVLKINPNRANGIYVADNAPYEERREELFKEIKPRDRLTDDEMNQAYRARARTIVPINEYIAGGFRQPVILINRELSLDEVELVSGPWPYAQLVRVVAEHSDDARRLLDEAIAARRAQWNDFRDESKKLACKEAVERLADYFTDATDEMIQVGAVLIAKLPYHRQYRHGVSFEQIVYTAIEQRELGLL